MEIAIVGNGILGLSTAFQLLKKSQSVRVKIIGKSSRIGSASLAAAAMFNSFCEVDPDTLSNNAEKFRFEFNKKSNTMWRSLLAELEYQSGINISSGFGTFLINNTVTDFLEDQSFDAVVRCLKNYNERYEFVEPSEIKNYKPSQKSRATRSIYIPSEGWVNPIDLIKAYDLSLERSGRVQFIDEDCVSLNEGSGIIKSIDLSSGEKIYADLFLLSAGANFTKILEHSKLPIGRVPRIFYGVGTSILIKTEAENLSNCVRTPNRGGACGTYSAPQTSESTLIGASNFVSPIPEFHGRLTSVHNLLKSAMEEINVNYYRAQLVKVNVGWRPISEDTLPIIGKTSIKNFFIASGTKRDGLHCSPLISNIMSDLILFGSSSEDIDLFKPERDLIWIYKREEAIDKGVSHYINALYQHGFVPSHNRILEDLERGYRNELIEIHDKAGLQHFGIHPELINMYKYGHAKK
jgi:glycine oxidase